MQPTRPPAAQLLYDLGLELDFEFILVEGALHTGSFDPSYAPWPPPLPHSLESVLKWKCPPHSLHASLPLCISAAPIPFGAHVARVKSPAKSKKDIAAEVVMEYLIGAKDMAMVYISPDPFYGAFKEELDLCKFDLSRHSTAGLNFFEKDQHLFLALMVPGTPGARIPWWRTQLRGAWLIAIDGTNISTLTDAQSIFCCLSNANSSGCTLLFSHPEITPDISSSGLPIMSRSDFSQLTHNQLNNRVNLLEDGLRILRTRSYDIVESGDVCQYVTRAMRLTRGKLIQQDDWSDRQASEFFQLNQYDAQGMFGEPVQVDKDDAVFFLVTYGVKTLDGCKKARCVCDGSSQSASVKILDETYTNSVDQTSSRLFYAILASENLLIFDADVSNAFAKTPPPKQGFYVRPDKAFHNWWELHKRRPPIPPGHVIPALSAMQGHPESPRL